MSRPAAALVLAALAAACGSEAPVNEETEARERFLRDVVTRDGVDGAWDVMSRIDVVFEDGWSRPDLLAGGRLLTPPGASSPDLLRDHARAATPDGAALPIAARWLGPVAHLRVRTRTPGDRRLRIRGAIDPRALFTRPRLTVTVDGREVWSQILDEGGFAVDVTVAAAALRGWSDVYLRLSSVSEPWREPERLRVAYVAGVSWEPTP